MKHHFSAALIFQILWVGTAFTQATIPVDGIIILVSKDTLRGTIRERDPDQKVSIRLPNSTTYREYSVDEVYSVGYGNGAYYKPLPMSSDPKGAKRFHLCIVEGAMDLFKYKDLFFVRKGNDPPVKLEKHDMRVQDTLKIDTHYRRLLHYLMSDCLGISRKIGKTEFNDVHLVQVVEQYNHCIDPSRPVTSRKEPVRIKVKKGVRAGVAMHQVRFRDKEPDSGPLRMVDLGTFTTFCGGVFFNFTYNDRFSIQPELLYTRKKGQFRGNFGGLYERAYAIDRTVLQLPVSIYYTLPLKKVRPFLSAGGQLGFALKNEAQKEFINTVTPMYPNAMELGYRGGAGLRFDLGGKSALYLEYLYEANQLRTETVQENFDFKSHHVSVRFGF